MKLLLTELDSCKVPKQSSFVYFVSAFKTSAFMLAKEIVNSLDELAIEKIELFFESELSTLNCNSF